MHSKTVQSPVGEAISLPPRGITACLVEWVIVQVCTNSPSEVHDWEVVLRGRMISSPTLAVQITGMHPKTVQSPVGEAISLAPRGITACLVEWVIVQVCTNSPSEVHDQEVALRGRMISSPTLAVQITGMHPKTVQSPVGEAISLPPRGITACLVEWVIVQVCTNSPSEVHDWEAVLRGRLIASPCIIKSVAKVW